MRELVRQQQLQIATQQQQIATLLQMTTAQQQAPAG
jgi:hypothetical protein